MSTLFAHKDFDGDELKVRDGELGVVIEVLDTEDGPCGSAVAVRWDVLPDLIAALQKAYLEGAN